MVRAAGLCRRVTFLMRPSDWDGLPDDLAPYEIFQSRLFQLARTIEPRWRSLFTGSDDDGPALPQAQAWQAVQGSLYGRGNRDYRGFPRQRSVLLLPPSAVTAVRRLLVDPEHLKRVLDPTDPLMIEFYQAIWNYEPDANWRVVHEAEVPPMPGQFGAGRFLARLVEPVSPQWAAVPPNAPVQVRFMPWDDVFERLIVRRQLAILADAYGRKPMLAGFAESPLLGLLPDWALRR